jgi:futalosine hydrolase
VSERSRVASEASDAPRRGPLLVVGATDLELAGIVAGLADVRPFDTDWGAARRGSLGSAAVVVQALGLGKVNTAAGLAVAIGALRPTAVLQVGIGGAYVGSFLSVGHALLADEEVQLDLGVRRPEGWADAASLALPLRRPRGDAGPTAAATAGDALAANAVATDAALTEAIAAATGVPRGRFATLDAITHDVHLGAAMQAAFDVSIESMEGAAAALTAWTLRVPFAEVRGVSNVVGDRDKARWDLRAAVAASTAVGLRALRALAADARWSPG